MLPCVLLGRASAGLQSSQVRFTSHVDSSTTGADEPTPFTETSLSPNAFSRRCEPVETSAVFSDLAFQRSRAQQYGVSRDCACESQLETKQYNHRIRPSFARYSHGKLSTGRHSAIPDRGHNIHSLARRELPFLIQSRFFPVAIRAAPLPVTSRMLGACPTSMEHILHLVTPGHGFVVWGSGRRCQTRD